MMIKKIFFTTLLSLLLVFGQSCKTISENNKSDSVVLGKKLEPNILAGLVALIGSTIIVFNILPSTFDTPFEPRVNATFDNKLQLVSFEKVLQAGIQLNASDREVQPNQIVLYYDQNKGNITDSSGTVVSLSSFLDKVSIPFRRKDSISPLITGVSKESLNAKVFWIQNSNNKIVKAWTIVARNSKKEKVLFGSSDIQEFVFYEKNRWEATLHINSSKEPPTVIMEIGNLEFQEKAFEVLQGYGNDAAKGAFTGIWTATGGMLLYYIFSNLLGKSVDDNR